MKYCLTAKWQTMANLFKSLTNAFTGFMVTWSVKILQIVMIHVMLFMIYSLSCGRPTGYST